MPMRLKLELRYRILDLDGFIDNKEFFRLANCEHGVYTLMLSFDTLS